MIRDFRTQIEKKNTQQQQHKHQEQRIKLLFAKLSSVCIFARSPIQFSIKFNRKINTANIYLTTNLDQIIDTTVTDSRYKKNRAHCIKKDELSKFFFPRCLLLVRFVVAKMRVERTI